MCKQDSTFDHYDDYNICDDDDYDWDDYDWDDYDWDDGQDPFDDIPNW